MLKYQLNRQTFDNDIINIEYSGVELTTYEDDPLNLMWVTLLCNNVDEIQPGDKLNITSNFISYNDETDDIRDISDAENIEVQSVDRIGNTITFLDKAYQEIYPDAIVARVDDDIITWIFSFPNAHYFSESEPISFDVYYTANDYVHIDGWQFINFNTVSWVYDFSVAEYLSLKIFGTSNPTETIDGDSDTVIVRRSQVKWDPLKQDPPTVKANKYKVRLNIPIALKSKTDLNKEGNLKEYFIEQEEEKAINSPIEMEKYAYTPVVVTSVNNGNPTFEDCTKINFNLHFRVHNGNDWTVNDSDSWNFDKYDHHNDPTANKYYSYAQNLVTGDGGKSEWQRSCQSDLLTYAGFITNDVKYQKNKLKKSFIRLSFYDSNDPGQQSLLAYSTIFVDCNKLYSKFISKMNFNCYYNSDGDIVKGIKVDREVNTLIPPDSLTAVLSTGSLKPEDIEEYRLSTQISVKNRFTSNNSSEGFYLYTWELNDIPTMPTDVYMKVEFNHAGYGRNIPMMAPYRDNPNNAGFKTNDEIVADWTAPNTGYGIKKYTRYSYIHLKVKYDVNTKRHIYYLDPDTYGTKYDWDKSILNINLYEARIAFE